MRHALLLLLPIAYCLLPNACFAQAIVLDAESAAYFQSLAQPLKPYLAHTGNIHFLIVADPQLNAFVDADKDIHLNSGLIEKARNPGELRGVIAHEMGHVAAQHLFQQESDTRNAAITSIAGAVLGVGAMAAGAPQVGAAMITGGQAGAIGTLLHHSRIDEEEADNQAIHALHAAGDSVSGMVSLFGRLRTETQLSYGNLPPYLVTHPLPESRLGYLQSALAAEKTSATEPAPDAAFTRIQARIYALTHSPAETLRRYPGPGDDARYARVIAAAQQGKNAEAQQGLDALLARHPHDYYYRATAADLAIDRGDLAAAHTLLAQLIRENPGNNLLQFQLGDVLRNLDKPAEALPHLEQSARDWPDWPQPWQSLGVVYGQLGRLAESHLALTEAALESADLPGAKAQLQIAEHELKTKPDPKLQSWRDALKSRLKRLD
jgi:predicted Zn-dependent protease